MKRSDESAESSELDGPPLRRRPPPQKHPKIEEKTRLQKTMLFFKKLSKSEPQSGPQHRSKLHPGVFFAYSKKH